MSVTLYFYQTCETITSQGQRDRQQSLVNLCLPYQTLFLELVQSGDGRTGAGAAKLLGIFKMTALSQIFPTFRGKL